MTDTAWRQHWFPVAFLRDLDRSKPTAFTLLEQDLVLWWDRAGDAWRAFADVCPHRLVPLSQGRLNSAGELECPYHGWSFAGDGHCTAIPQALEGASPSTTRSGCRAYATAEAQGLLFVFAGEAAGASAVPLPLVPVLEEPGWFVQDTFRDLPMDALTLLENVLDVSHVPFTHHRTVGKRENAAPVEAVITGSGPWGFTALWEEGPRKGKLGSQHTTFAAPGLMWHDLTASGFARILTVVYATPIRRGECRLFARFPFRFESRLPSLLLALRPLWLQHIANHIVLEDDQVFLHWQERVLEERGRSDGAERAFFLATRADVYVRALHDWVNRFAGDPFPGQSLPPRLDDGALMDRWHSHTRHCAACSGALRGIRRWRPLVAALPWLALLGIAWWHSLPVLAAGVALAGAAWLLGRRLDRWEQLLQAGDGHPPRNRHE
ncbi:Rieske 2Fe-2S domain-containing protein [Synechococcus sp. CCY 9618]|uniref:aromatic ring-hydroxylating dioxygenase subunit alpha n=1 Tax=Synechococcus sp. CCY 9618 TaxID=2815602 RepID=UPI001C224A39|nr:Rieske 2Fe-2S domain-containing protein [Synechococcus sp. CCY 9618]